MPRPTPFASPRGPASWLRPTAAALFLLALAWPVASRAERGSRPQSQPGLYLAIGAGPSDVGTIVNAAGGFWLGPVLPTVIWRATAAGSPRGQTSLIGGRLDLGIWPDDWVSLRAGVGAGKLEYRAPGAFASRPAVVAGFTVSFGSDYLNLVGFGAEIMLPLGARPGGPVPFTAAPSVMATLELQPLVLYAMK
jgi:hypothetical protein